MITQEEEQTLVMGQYAEELMESEPFRQIMSVVMHEANAALLSSPVKDREGREVLYLTHKAYDDLLARVGSMAGAKKQLTEDLNRRTEESSSETDEQPSEADDYL